MRPPHFVDCVEVAPGLWASPEEADLVRARGLAIEDANDKTRPRTVDDIPVLGSPIEFLAFVALLTTLVIFWRG
jgi:hypothetical protein